MVNAFIEEHISGVSVVRIFSREKSVLSDFDRRNDDYFEAAIGQVKIFCIYIPVVQFLTIAGTAVIYWYGGLRILGTTMSYGTLVAFVQYLRMFFRPLREMIMKYNVIQSAMAAALNECLSSWNLIDSFTRLYRKKIKRNVQTIQTIFCGLVATSNSRMCGLPIKMKTGFSRGISFEVPKGTSLAFVGATGAGKTSIISLLLRHYEFQKGSITVDGRDIRTIPVKELRQSFGCVRQDVFTFSGTIEDNIRLSLIDTPHDEVRTAAEQANALRFITELPQGFDTQVGERGQMLSMGQRQLISFARGHPPSPLHSSS